MNKVIAKIIGVLSFLILVVVIIFYLLDLKKRKDVSDSIINFFKNGVSSSYLDEDPFKQLTYATTKDVNNYNITKFVNDYKEILHNCIISKIDSNNVVEYSKNHYTLINHNVGEITIYAMDSSAIKFIKNKLTDNDINEYLNGTFDSKIENELKKVFLKNNKDEWFLIGDKDKIIDLQYNIYLRYVSNKKENNYDDISFIDMKIKKSLNKNFIKGQKRVPVLVRYKDNNGEIHTNDADLLVEYDENNNLKINLYYFFRTFYKNANGASITAGQHDYDEEIKREQAELDEYIEERLKQGLEPTPQMNWDDYDEDGNYIGKDDARMITSDEFEEIMMRNRERAKELGIEESTLSKEEAIEKWNKIKQGIK